MTIPEVPSYYSASIGSLPDFPTFSGKKSGKKAFDVAVIGGGLTGISAALELVAKGYRTCLLESHYPGWGASGRNGGQLLTGFACGQPPLERQKSLGLEGARQLFNLSRDAVQLVKDRIKKYHIDCDYASGHLDTAIWPYQEKALRRKQADLQTKYDYPTEFWQADRLGEVISSPRYRAGLFDPFSGHLHPLKYAVGLVNAAKSQGVEIFQQSKVAGFTRQGSKIHLTCNDGEIICDHLVLATNAYLGKLHRELSKYIMPMSTFIIATQPLGSVRAKELMRHNYAITDINFDLDYFRLSADHRLLFGGLHNYSTRPPVSIERSLRKKMLRVFPRLVDVGIDYAWGGFVGVTINRVPQLGRLAPNIYYAHGFTGRGLAFSNMAGFILAQAIHGEQHNLALFEKIKHRAFIGGELLRMPLLVLAGLYGKLRDSLGPLR